MTTSLVIKTLKFFIVVVQTLVYEQIIHWHLRLGHPSLAYLQYMCTTFFNNLESLTLNVKVVSCWNAQNHIVLQTYII